MQAQKLLALASRLLHVIGPERARSRLATHHHELIACNQPSTNPARGDGCHAALTPAHACRSRFRYFLWLNSSGRGPFLPPYYAEISRGAAWTRVFTAKLNERVKLVGSTISCGGGYTQAPTPHVQTYAVATDRQGLEILLAKVGLLGVVISIQNLCAQAAAILLVSRCLLRGLLQRAACSPGGLLVPLVATTPSLDTAPPSVAQQQQPWHAWPPERVQDARSTPQSHTGPGHRAQSSAAGPT